MAALGDSWPEVLGFSFDGGGGDPLVVVDVTGEGSSRALKPGEVSSPQTVPLIRCCSGWAAPEKFLFFGREGGRHRGRQQPRAQARRGPRQKKRVLRR